MVTLIILACIILNVHLKHLKLYSYHRMCYQWRVDESNLHLKHEVSTQQNTSVFRSFSTWL